MYNSSCWPADLFTPPTSSSHQQTHHYTGSNSSSDDPQYLSSPHANGPIENWSHPIQQQQQHSSGSGYQFVYNSSTGSATIPCERLPNDYASLSNGHGFPPPIKYVAVSAQWVYHGHNPKVPMVVRVAITDWRGSTLLDTFVRPSHPVTDYRFAETGLQEFHLQSAPRVLDIQKLVHGIIENKIIVGYQLWNFLSLLQLSHPAIDTRDTASFTPFRKSLRWKRKKIVPLPILVDKFMRRGFGKGYEHPLENARACLDLFRSTQTVWENLVQQGFWPCSTLEDVPEYAYGCFT